MSAKGKINFALIFFMKTFKLLFIFLFFSVKSFSQDWEYGGWLGVSHYFGDLNTSTSFRFVRPAGGLLLRRCFNSHFSARGTISGGYVGYNDKFSKKIFQQKRNLSFTSPIVELSGQLEFNFFKMEIGDDFKRFSPYLFGGFGVFYFNPKTGGEKLKKYGTEGQDLQIYPERNKYSLIQPTVLYGGGLKYRPKKSFWTIGIEAGNRKTFTDYLDDASTVYPDKFALASERGVRAVELSDRSGETGDIIGEEGKQRGDSQRNDSYLFVGFTLTYTLRNIKCPNPTN